MNFNYYIFQIFLCSYFLQQAFVLNLGGSIKIFDLLGLVFALHQLRYHTLNTVTFLVLCMSLLGLVLIFFEPNFNFRNTYLELYPSASMSIRHGTYGGPMYVGVLLLVWYSSTRILSSDKFLVFPTKIKLKIIENFINFGVLVSLYSIWAMVFVGNFSFPDLVPNVFDARNSQPEDYPFRTIGFSDEPSMLFVTLNFLLFVMVSMGRAVSIRHLKLKIFIVALSMLLTFSSLMVSIVVAAFIYGVMKLDLKITGIMIFACGICIAALYLVAKYFGILNFLIYTFYSKFLTFFSTDITVGAGFRSFTARTGVEAILQYPIGTGFGQHFVLWQSYLSENNLSHPSLDYSSVVQNGLVQFALEFGILGLFLFLYYFYHIYTQAIRNLNSAHTSRAIMHIWFISHFIIGFVAFPVYSPIYYFPILFMLWATYSIKVKNG